MRVERVIKVKHRYGEWAVFAKVVNGSPRYECLDASNPCRNVEWTGKVLRIGFCEYRRSDCEVETLKSVHFKYEGYDVIVAQHKIHGETFYTVYTRHETDKEWEAAERPQEWMSWQMCARVGQAMKELESRGHD